MARSCLIVAGVVAITLFGTSRSAQADDRALAETFEKEVRPILVNRCQSCHGTQKQKGGLRLDSRSALLAGGGTGPAVVPGKPRESLLIEAINYAEDLQMPPKSKLPAAEIAVLTRWVQSGAVWPGGDVRPATSKAGFDLAERAKHWCFQPLKVVEPPRVKAEARVRTPVDRFLLRDLEAKGLTFAPEADRATLIRRLSFDLTGLPPSPEEIAAFQNDPRPDAYEQLVERLLASPRYGERWGRKWLDLVRFAETAGHEFDYDIPFAWRYRDYVVRALNQDVPYNQFVLEHLAGDLLPHPRRNPADNANESIQGTGFFMLGEGTHSPVDIREEQQRRTDNQIEVLGKAFLSLTVACTRCHDHKFDPMTQRDYYALAGIIESSRHQYAPIDDEAPRKAAIARISSAKSTSVRLDRDRFFQALKKLEPELRKPEPKPIEVAGVFETFDHGFEDWTVTGEAFGEQPSVVGSNHLVGTKLETVPSGWARSDLIAGKLSGVIRSKTFKIEHPFIQLRLMGKNGLVQVVVDGFEKIRSPIYGGLGRRVNNEDKPGWMVIDASMWRGHPAYIEVSDGGVADFQGGHTLVDEGAGFVAVDEIRFADSPTVEGTDRGAFPRVMAPAANETFASWSSRLADVIDVGCGDDAPARDLIDWAAENRLIGVDLAATDEGRARLERIHAAEKELGPLRLVPALVDGTGLDANVLVRGQAKTPGVVAPRRFLEVIAGSKQPPIPQGSGRLELAQRMVEPSNPLPARSMVNRIWKAHFGEGIVRSMDDFGLMGEKPSHPELLDWLASTFQKRGWSIKEMHRLMVCSTAYRMSSKLLDPKVEATDPNNRLLHRANLRRLEAEEIRDAILAVSGRLNLALGGPGVPPHLTPFMEGRGRPGHSGPLDGDGRRTIYLTVRRNFLSPLLLVFDYPPPATAMGRRNVSNVPAQALTLLNDPFVLDQARLWAEREKKRGGDDGSRLEHAYLCGMGRVPSDRERAAALAFLDEIRKEKGDDAAWSELCHSLMNTKSFLFVE